MAQKLAIEIRDGDQRRCRLNSASKAVDTDTTTAMLPRNLCELYALNDGVQPGLANADATFLINYN